MNCDSCGFPDPVNGVLPFKYLNCIPDEPPTEMQVCMFCSRGRTEGIDLPEDKSVMFALNTMRKDLLGLGIKPFEPSNGNFLKRLWRNVAR